ncbi:DUF5941 domain-containing protein [Kitasatospora sp. NPDC054939]
MFDLAWQAGSPERLPAAFGLVAAVAYHHIRHGARIHRGTGAPCAARGAAPRHAAAPIGPHLPGGGAAPEQHDGSGDTA